jgi:hypothetical protein
MEAWATVTVALASALFGGFLGSLLTTWMRIRHEREEALRARMIEAADEFIRRSIEALNALHRLVHVVEPDDLDINEEIFDEIKSHADEVFAAPLAESRPLVDETRVHLARVHLLFGSRTETGRAALSLVSNMSFVLQVVGEEPGIVDVNLARRTLNKAQAAYDEFALLARVALRRPDLGDEAPERESAGANAGPA